MNLITLGGWVFWTILGIYFILLIWSIEEGGESELGTPTLITVIAAVLMIICCKDFYIQGYKNVESNGFTCLLWVLFYLLIGIAWSFFKWALYVRQKAIEYKIYMDRNPEYDREKFLKEAMPAVSDNKEQLSTWILLFPISILRYLVGDFLTDIVNSIVKSFTRIYDQITKSQFK